MNTFLTTLIIAISLSMDAFSLSLVYGTLNIDKKNKISTTVDVLVNKYKEGILKN